MQLIRLYVCIICEVMSRLCPGCAMPSARNHHIHTQTPVVLQGVHQMRHLEMHGRPVLATYMQSAFLLHEVDEERSHRNQCEPETQHCLWARSHKASSGYDATKHHAAMLADDPLCIQVVDKGRQASTTTQHGCVRSQADETVSGSWTLLTTRKSSSCTSAAGGLGTSRLVHRAAVLPALGLLAL